MIVSETTLKWGMRFYPPLLLQSIWVRRFKKDFKGIEVKIIKSIVNINFNRSIFGGTIYSAADPVYPVLYYQIMKRKGLNVMVWQKAGAIEFIKPGYQSLYFSVDLSEEEIIEAYNTLQEHGKFVKTYIIEITDKLVAVCSRVEITAYIRKR